MGYSIFFVLNMSLVTGNNSIDALVYSSWASNAGTPVHLTYSFMNSLPFDASADDAHGFRPMTAAQQDGARQALGLWASVANIVFSEVSSNGQIQLGTNNQGSLSSGYAYLPDGHNPAYLYTNNLDGFNADFSPGSYGPTVLMHEIGHTLGLKHPGNYDSAGSSIGGPFLPAATDNGDYSLMSYNPNSGFNEQGQYDATPMLYDIQAMQYLYGANLSYHSGNDTYRFVSSSAPQCIWDAGGTDTMDFSACDGPVVINLNAGTFSSTSPGYGNISIAYNVTIEQALAGNGGSTIYCNDAGDKIAGGAGNDVITEGAGSDIINGGGGSDTVIFGGKASHYVLSHTSAGVTVSGDGTDTLTGIAFLQFADATITVDKLPLLLKPLADQAAHATASFSLGLDDTVFSATGGSAIVLTLSQADGDALPAWLQFDQQTGILSGTPGQGDVGALSLRISASNGLGVSVIDDFKLAVSSSVLQGGPGNDALYAGDGDESINGGAGIDTLHYSGSLSDYTVVASGSNFKVTDLVGKGGVDTLTSVERIEFANGGGLALDTGASAGELYRLFEAMFNRQPDQPGMGYWLTQMDRGATVGAIAAGFIDSAEFKSLYGDNASNGVYIGALYNNVLHRASDQAGFDYWNTALSHGATREQVLVQFSDSNENVAAFNGLHLVGINYTPWVG